jgi:hypothetical protein
MSIRCGHCKGRHESVADVRTCSAPVMTLDMAKAIGRRTGRCQVCHRLLTNPDSIAAGIGPVCAGRF